MKKAVPILNAGFELEEAIVDTSGEFFIRRNGLHVTETFKRYLFSVISAPTRGEQLEARVCLYVSTGIEEKEIKRFFDSKPSAFNWVFTYGDIIKSKLGGK